MPLRHALATALVLVAASPAAAIAGEPAEVAWDDACGDHAPSLTVAGQRQALPAATGDGLDLDGASLRTDGDVLTIRLETCGAPHQGRQGYYELAGSLADGCRLTFAVHQQYHVLPPSGEPAEEGLAAQIGRTCQTQLGPVGTYDTDPITALPRGAFAFENRALVLTVDRSALPADVAALMAPGTRLANVTAVTGEYGSVRSSSLSVNDTPVLVLAPGAADTASGPAELVLG